ncbi:S9 family peptidase [Shewanella sp. NIFS-20-20]|uniref:S9 family peptidase n=1 Tax=Shewanella sp. NIFS-20-20 TaxID=2853806 RepID=UPI001C45E281|nr:S9 family peptidase [Shewanella sp. NIFS-20-20]MBV7315057.1 S9 family peptidase [Shewanella sp. NIFS-20-20]
MKKSKLFMALALVGASQVAYGAQPSPFTVQDLVKLNKQHSAAVSSDGQTLVYGLNVMDDQGQRESELYLVNLAKPEASPQQLTAVKGTEHSVTFAPDNQSIYFLANRNGTTQLFNLSLNGGEARAISDLPLNIDGYRLDNAGQQVAMQLRVFPECDTLVCSEEKFAEQAKTPNAGREYDQLMVRHWDTWHDHARNHLFVAPITAKGLGKPVDVTAGLDTETPPKPFSGMEEVTFSPDGKTLVYTAKAPSADQAWTTNYDLWQVPVTGGEATNLTANNLAWDAHATYSADGRYLAYLAMARPGFEADRYAIMLRDTVTGQEKEVAPLWDRSPHSLQFSADGKTLYVSAQDLGQVSLFEVNTQFGDVKRLYNDGSNSVIAVTPDALFFSRKSLIEPGDIYRLDLADNKVTRLTQTNKDRLANIQFGEFDQFSFKGWNNETVYGYWLKPANYEKGKQYPIAYLVHGGPQGSFGNNFSHRWNPQLWAGAGYGVVMVDFHGSTGYGQAFTDSITQDWGGKPLEDLQKGLDAVATQQPWLDKNNACALGGSYGGYMMNWFQGNWPDGFKCLVNHAGLFDMRSMYYVTEELWFPEFEFGGQYQDNKALYEQFNPVNYVEHWKTPMLVIHGEKDFRVPYGQGLAAFTYMQRNNIPSKLLMYPTENHWILTPDNLEQWYDNVLGWLDTYTAK